MWLFNRRALSRNQRLTQILNNMNAIAALFPIAWIAFTVGSIIYALKLLAQIAHTQERVVAALEAIARKLEGGNNPGAH